MYFLIHFLTVAHMHLEVSVPTLSATTTYKPHMNKTTPESLTIKLYSRLSPSENHLYISLLYDFRLHLQIVREEVIAHFHSY